MTLILSIKTSMKAWFEPLNVLLMRFCLVQFEASVKYHGHAAWTRWMTPESGRRSALYLGTSLGRETSLLTTSYVCNALQQSFVRLHTLCNVIPGPSEPPAIPDHPRGHPGLLVSHHPLHHTGHQEIKIQIWWGKDNLFLSFIRQEVISWIKRKTTF